MFDFVRSHTKLLQFVLLLVIFPLFVFSGIQGYSNFTDPSNATVANVGGLKIKQGELDMAHRQQIERMHQQMPNIDLKLLETPEMKARTLDGLVRDRVMRMAVSTENIVITDDRLGKSFQTDPQFAAIRLPDGSVNKEFLAARGLNSKMFEQQLRDDMAIRQVTQGVTAGPIIGQAATNTALDAMLQGREVQLQRFNAKDYLTKVEPTDAELEAYYKGHASQFKTPEEARIEYVVLDLSTLKKQLTLSEDDLKKYYEENIARYTSAEERRAAHILVTSSKDAPAADREKAKARAEDLLAQARKNPAGFAELAKKFSDDKGSATNGGDLDFFGRGAMVKPFEDTAFAMKAGDISNLVESDFGFHIIKVIAVRGGEKKPFDAVRAEIVEEVGKPKAQELYAAAAEQFNNTVYEQSDSLQPVIEKLKLVKAEATVQRRPAPGASGPLAAPKFLDAVFSSDVVKNKRNTEAVETGANQLVSARILEHKPERVLPLAEVRDKVMQVVRAEQAAAAAKKDGEARVASLKANPGESLPQVVTVSRTQRHDLPGPVVDGVLRADVSKGPTAIGIDLGNEGYVAARILKVVERQSEDPNAEGAKPYIQQAVSAAESEAYYEALKRRYKVKVEAVAGAAAAASSAATN